MSDRIRRFLYSPNSKYVISVILGIGLASLFRKVCKDRNCLIFKAPEIKKVEGQIFKFNNKCYTFNKNATSCDQNKRIVSFE